jgi:hypothetical protein
MTTKKTAKKPVKKTKTNIVIKNPVGQQPKYFPWMNKVAETLAREGKNQKYIYKVLGISEATGIKYKKEHKDFAKALEDGYEDPIKVAESVLYKLVKGYEYDSVQVAIISDGGQIGSHWEKVPIKKVVEPNLRAVEFALNNWKPRKQYPLDGYGEMLEINGKMEYKVIPDDELEDKE